MIFPMRLLSFWIVFKSSPTVSGTSSRRASSALAEIMVTGVRSSWDASDVNCRSRWNEVSSLSIILLNVSPSSPTSSLTGMGGMRAERSVSSAISPAVAVIWRTGRRERRERSHAPRIPIRR